ncbi:MAG TPA: YihY/virulence factor BrkB family protein [Acidimicrobiales bacterium]|nr:YihY/virulence factor BrkB family protein [Acidimicrobiales bacterium]
MHRIEAVARRVDRFQQRHLVTSVLFGLVKKYGDDNGGALASNMAFSAFGTVFPLLLLLVTTLGIVLAHDPALRARVLHSALSEFPVIGTNLGHNIRAIERKSAVAYAVSILVLIWTCTGLAQGGLFAMSQIWNLPGPQRPNFIARLGRSLTFLVVLALGLIVSTAVASIGTVAGHGVLVGGLVDVGAAAVNVGQYFLAFRILTPRVVSPRCLVPGAIVGGVLWTVLQALGAVLVWHALRGVSELYGTFAIVLGLLAWIRLGVTLSIYAAEFNTVLARHLWPRNIVQPPLTSADQESLAAQATQNQRRPEQRVEVSFTEPAATQEDFLDRSSPRH